MGHHSVLFFYGGAVGFVGMILILDVVSRYINTGPLDYWLKNSAILLCIYTALNFKIIAEVRWRKVAYMADHVSFEYIIEQMFELVVLMLVLY